MPFATIATQPTEPAPLPPVPGSAAAIDVTAVTSASPPGLQMAKAVQGGVGMLLADKPDDPHWAATSYWDNVWANTTPGSHLWEVARSVQWELSALDHWDHDVYTAWLQRQANRLPEQFGLYPNG